MLFPSRRLEKHCCRPVSYTHLDVYKRQDKNTTNGAVNEYIFTIEFDAILPTIIPMIDIKRG